MGRRYGPPLPYWARKRAQEREAEANARAADRMGHLMGFEGQDPQAIIDAAKRDVRALFVTGGYRCLDCRPPKTEHPIDIWINPDTPCGKCGRPVGEAKPEPVHYGRQRRRRR